MWVRVRVRVRAERCGLGSGLGALRLGLSGPRLERDLAVAVLEDLLLELGGVTPAAEARLEELLLREVLLG